MFKRQSFDPSCPSGGSFYACTSGTRFVGCCNDDPCQTGCSDGNLEPASFNPALYGTIQDQECPMGSEWYTCTTTNPPFMGCCKSNPCSSTYGCPTGDVTAGFLSSNPAVAKGFLPAAASSSSAASSPTSASHSSSATSASASASAATLTNTPTHKITTGAIAGGAIGGFAGLALLLALLALFLRRTTAKSRRHMAEGRSQSQGSATRSPVPFQADKAGKATEEPTQNPFSTTPMSTPAPMYTPYRAEGSQLDSSSNTTFPSPPVPELPSPPPPSNLYESITPFAPNDIYPTLGSCSNGLGVSLSTAPIPPAELHSPDVRSACPGPEGRAPSYTR